MPRQNPRQRSQPSPPDTSVKKKGKKEWDKGQSKGDYHKSFGVFQSTIMEAQAKAGNTQTIVGTQAELVVIGIPLKAFSLQYLHSSTVYPLGRMEMIIGESDSCKTAFLFEKGRWYLREEGGGFVYLLNEARDPADLRTSIIGKELLDRGGFRREGPCESLEDWQRRQTGLLHQFENTFRVHGGCAFPFMSGLDSITGTTNEKAIANIDKEGCAKLTFGQDANLLNQYAKYLFQRLYKWPGSFICTNHIKYGQDSYGNKVLRIPGGDELRYVSTYITHLSSKKVIDRLDVGGGRRINIKMMKSMGDKRELGVDFVWQYKKGGEQTSVWDWHSATIELLAEFSGERKKQLDDIISFPNYNKTQRTVSCPELGFRKAAPFDEVGKALMDGGKVLEELQDHLGIKRRRSFQAGVSYTDQIAAALEAGEVVKADFSDIEGAAKEDDEVVEQPSEIAE